MLGGVYANLARRVTGGKFPQFKLVVNLARADAIAKGRFLGGYKRGVPAPARPRFPYRRQPLYWVRLPECETDRWPVRSCHNLSIVQR